ncbi:MAG: aldo/keto reductase [bacterium]|nr:aldo/keto reductase [bacterium]
MQQRKLGKIGPSVSALGLGCMGMSEFYGTSDMKENIKVLHRALDLGCSFWDTADMYGVGLNEVLLSHVLRERRNEVFIATKFANVRSFDGSFLGVNGKPEYVKRCCDASLMRLGVEQIDLYYQHRIDPKVPIEETWGAMKELVDAGKVKYLGISEAGPKTVRRAHAVHPMAAAQYEYSMWTRDIELELLPVCRELGIAMVPYSPLGRGFLTGHYADTAQISSPGDARAHFPRFEGENLTSNRAWLLKIEDKAKQHGCTTAQLALAWVLAKGEDMIPIPGTKKIQRLEENLKALEIRLSAGDVSELDQLADPGAIAGGRYPAFSISSTMAESI